ncbi:MAG: aldehyde ferredoxin oxidoreductase C-terminal domain-containing protein [Desulfocapsaceae bacterium]|nr:aldehyde ferredoxin oxidoreductase C-terminal domain-containing protein [Desulfocapsaceae bacterium]
MDKILRINVGAPGGPTLTEESCGDYAGLGGRALTSALVNKEVPADCHPLGPENKLVIAPGLLSGTAAVTSGRLSVGCKSPLTGGIKEANSGGQGAQILARLGYAAIVLEGEWDGETLYKVVVNKDGATIEKANDLKMMTNYQLMEKFQDLYTKGAMLSIGTAGEMRLSNSTIAVTDKEQRPTRHAGRGGVGAVMGSKGIKVIILDGDGTKMREPKNKEAFSDANKRFNQGLKDHAVTGQGLPTYGTNVLTNLLNEAGGYPTYNFKQGNFPDAEKISGETQAELEIARGGKATHGCHRGCSIQCSGTFLDKDGNYVTKQPEYETVWSHGGNCGICDLDAIAKLDFLDDDFGLDTIEMGVTIGVAMEAGLLKFGDAEGAINLVKEVGSGTPLGRILGSGAATTARAYGIEKAPVVKGQGMPAYDPRAVKGIGVTYATSPMGADHTAGYAVATNILKVGGDVDPLSPEGQAELSKNLQIATASVDSTGMCLFIAFAVLDQPETFQALIDLLNGFYGLELTADDVVALGKSILDNERDFNARAGFTAEDDRLPRYFKRDKLPPHDVTFDVPDEDLDKVFQW